MIALIDADMVAYRCAASCEPTKEKLEREPLDIAIQRADELAYRILNTTQAEEHRFFLSGSDNFRKILYPEYKANRARLPRPEWLDPLREFLVTEWKAEVTAGYEADDGIGIAAKEDFVIVSNDKDFLQIPGEHYNPVKDEFKTVDREFAVYSFWRQMLVGDSSDNVRGIDGIGPVRADKILRNLRPEDMEHTVREYYQDGERFLLNYRLLRILRSEEEYENIISQGQGQKITTEST